MLREELQQYFDNYYPGSKIDNEHSIFGPVHIRFELGGELENGTKERVQQASQRATELFETTFGFRTHKIWMLAYDYNQDEVSNTYFRSLFTDEQFSGFYHQLEDINTSYSTSDHSNNEELETIKARITIGKLPAIEMPYASIMESIASYEMGFSPYLNQRIIFIDPILHCAFLMYDDRGCYVWSKESDNIFWLYINYNDWIVDYHRPEIDEYFK